jgi:MoaA/NifB/PqqE/SkfB family radical SAM enzyme
MNGIEGLRGLREPFSPLYMNTAFREIFCDPKDLRSVGDNPSRMVEALLAQRDVSQVPWIFNSLVNEIEFRIGSVYPNSFPSDIHLSLTGDCNIECRFCGYIHEIARHDFVNASQIAKMGFFRHNRTLRLSGGLGEPTLNPNLPDIIRSISEKHPHLEINFFTNGLLLNGLNLIDAMIGKVRWINVSLNAASRESWKRQCLVDEFDKVLENLHVLLKAKREQQTIFPLVFGSMVLSQANMADLPKMPALARELGVDRFTAFPYSALRLISPPDKFGPEMALESNRDGYGKIYEETVRNAEDHCVSLEIPPPDNNADSTFGVEIRPFYDFAHIEYNAWPLGRFLEGIKFTHPPEFFCHFLWRYASIANTYNIGHASNVSHFLYPCIGPISGVDLSRRTAFYFEEAGSFSKLWRNQVFAHLRKAQHRRGVCEICDICRRGNTRDPILLEKLEYLAKQFEKTYGGFHSGS